jgi:hypothetical protein
MHPKKSNARRILTLMALSALCALFLCMAYQQIVFFMRIVTRGTLGWPAAAGALFRFVLVLILTVGAGAGPFIFIYRQIFPKKPKNMSGAAS